LSHARAFEIGLSSRQTVQRMKSSRLSVSKQTSSVASPPAVIEPYVLVCMAPGRMRYPHPPSICC